MIVIMGSLKFFVFGIIWFEAYLKVQSGSVQFCDGPTRMERTREQCGAGISFGDIKPDCICVQGVYRFVADSCETADGFAESVCTKLTDENGMGASIVGVKFTKDPVNWSQTGVVCEKKGFGSETWDFITEKNSKGSTSKSTNIYAVNGKAFVIKGRHDKPALCIEPAKQPDDEKVCRYLKSENDEHWSEGSVEVFVKSQCENGKPLKPHKCFGILKSADSECQLTCSNTTSRGFGRSLASPTSKNGKSKDKMPTGRSAAAAPATPTVAPLSDAAHPAEYWKYDNRYWNRKMMIYNIINQLESNTTKSVFGEPKKTFELFNVMKNITLTYCPSEFVDPDWIELVVELFYILHKGDIFKYDENLSEGEFGWIQDILTRCQERVNSSPDERIELKSIPTMTDPIPDDICSSHGGLATGYCNGTSIDGECNFKPIGVDPDRANDSIHYVPDVAWDIVDIIQVVCFQEFNESYRMFHVLEQAAEKLFTLQIKNLWYYPNWSVKTKKRLLGTSADSQMHNFEVCINSAYDKNLGQIPRLVRPGPTKYLKRKKRGTPRQHVSQGQYIDVYCSKTKKDFVIPNCSKA